MATIVTDDTVPLNAGSGGKTLDAAQVTQASGAVVTRERMAVGGDTGLIQSFEDHAGRVAGQVDDRALQGLLAEHLVETRRVKTLLRVLLAELAGVTLSDDELDSLEGS